MTALTRERALIFRITHIDNVPWMLNHGVRCRSSDVFDPNYRNIGNPDLIARRTLRAVHIPPGGTLSDYVPFYFTPRSIMLYNIKTGYNVPNVPNGKIVILVSSLPRLVELNIDFIFTDRHAYLSTAQFFNSLDDLGEIAWPILQAGDFRNDPENPEKKEKYQAEALVYGCLPVEALHGIVCHDAVAEEELQRELQRHNMVLKVTKLPKWYF